MQLAAVRWEIRRRVRVSGARCSMPPLAVCCVCLHPSSGASPSKVLFSLNRATHADNEKTRRARLTAHDILSTNGPSTQPQNRVPPRGGVGGPRSAHVVCRIPPTSCARRHPTSLFLYTGTPSPLGDELCPRCIVHHPLPTSHIPTPLKAGTHEHDHRDFHAIFRYGSAGPLACLVQRDSMEPRP